MDLVAKRVFFKNNFKEEKLPLPIRLEWRSRPYRGAVRPPWRTVQRSRLIINLSVPITNTRDRVALVVRHDTIGNRVVSKVCNPDSEGTDYYWSMIWEVHGYFCSVLERRNSSIWKENLGLKSSLSPLFTISQILELNTIISYQPFPAIYRKQIASLLELQRDEYAVESPFYRRSEVDCCRKLTEGWKNIYVDGYDWLCGRDA